MEWKLSNKELPKTNDIVVILISGKSFWERGYFQNGHWFDPYGLEIMDVVEYWLQVELPVKETPKPTITYYGMFGAIHQYYAKKQNP